MFPTSSKFQKKTFSKNINDNQKEEGKKLKRNFLKKTKKQEKGKEVSDIKEKKRNRSLR